jgi:FKBP-type peptidyl-prolyl cis-trans isomerase (trigger factor)
MASKKKNTTKKQDKPKLNKTNTTMAKSEDGTIQLTFIIPFKKIKKAREEAAEKLGKNVEIPGFRKGKAPVDKVMDHVSQNALLEQTLSGILPKLLGEAINEHKIQPAIYPKFELVKAKEGEAWEVRATTCELPKVDLKDYKKALISESKSSEIWTPEKGDPEKKKEPSREEKEQLVIKTLMETVEVKVPHILIDEETNSRLSRLLERLEQMGLTLESYLGSIGKKAEDLRKQYENQAQEAIKLDLVLNEVAKEEDIKVKDDQIEAALKAASADPNVAKNKQSEQQKRLIESVLRRKAALDKLTSLIQ